MDTAEFFGKERISRILLKLAPPVMLAQLIQALYNIVDSLFVGRYSQSGLTALSILYSLQLLMIALAVGTGVGIAPYEYLQNVHSSIVPDKCGSLLTLNNSCARISVKVNTSFSASVAGWAFGRE